MVGWEHVYKLAEAMVPLYAALILGYGSVKWWHIFTPEQGDAISRLVFYIVLPLLTFELAVAVDPFKLNYRFIAADAISKCILVAAIGFWAKCFSSSSSCGSWGITSFSLGISNNILILGVPLMKAMHGQMGYELVVQATVVQALLWMTSLLFAMEFRRSRTEDDQSFADEKSTIANTVEDARVVDGGQDLEGNQNRNAPVVLKGGQDLEGNQNRNAPVVLKTTTRRPLSLWSLMKVLRRLALNPNSYACFLGITWAFFSIRFHLKMPNIVEESILIMSRGGTGLAMFSMGVFTGRQEKILACGAGLTLYGMVVRFIAGPAAMAIGAITFGLRGNVLRIAILQAAMPQSTASFIYAKQYGLHANVISTAVIFGTMVSLPLLMAYYAALESFH